MAQSLVTVVSAGGPSPTPPMDDGVPVDAQLEALFDEFHVAYRKARLAWQRTLEDARDAGAVLLKIKAHVKHGNWLGWIGDQMNIGRTACEDLMYLASNWKRLEELSKSRHAGNLGLEGPGSLSIRAARRLLHDDKTQGRWNPLEGRRAAIPPGGNDRVMTPESLALMIVAKFRPKGTILEPCAGTGAFADALRGAGRRVFTSEIARNEYQRSSPRRDFLMWKQPVTWIITNPPWSQFQPFLKHAMTLAPNVVFVAPVVHWWTKRRVRDVRAAGFSYKRLILIEGHPEGWPETGFQLGAMHVVRGYQGPLRID